MIPMLDHHIQCRQQHRRMCYYLPTRGGHGLSHAHTGVMIKVMILSHADNDLYIYIYTAVEHKKKRT